MAMTAYEKTKRWRLKHPEKRSRGKARYYRKTAFSENSSRRWSSEEINIIMKHTMPDSDIAELLGRSVMAIQIKRHKLMKGMEKHNDKDRKAD